MLEEGLEELREFRDGVLKLVRHDLRTPVSAMASLSEMLAADADLTPRQARMVELLQASVAQLVGMLDTVLEYAALQSQPPPALEPVPLDPLVRDVVEEHAEAAWQARVRLALEAAEPGPVVLGHAPHLRALVGHLLVNALRHSPPGSEVQVRVEAGPGTASLVVHDQGAGLPEGARERIFEPFVRLNRGPGDSVPAAGLGLAIAARVAREHGGTIQASTHGGACFRVVLPAVG